MAWRSSGTTNDEMVDNLKRYGVIQSDSVESGFRSVDRKYFVLKEYEDIAHTDQPLKHGNFHISAPHVYASALEALELVSDSALSFLNVGSGTGYLSCIVAECLGHRSLNYGVEIHSDVVEHSENCILKWAQDRDISKKKLPKIELIHGNAFHLSEDAGESIVGFDRIYIGAAVPRGSLDKFSSLLRPGGILVGPVDDELVKIVRIGSIEGSSLNENTHTHTDPNNFTQQVLSGVRFAPLLTLPVMKTIIPSKVWTPKSHTDYPDSFRKSSKALLLCSRSSYVQPPPKAQKPQYRTNLAAVLPPVLWMEILSFTNRNWFEPPEQDTVLLRKRLFEEQSTARKAHEARLEAEARCRILERERDAYCRLARRWKARLEALVDEHQHGVAPFGDASVLDTETDRILVSLALHGTEAFASVGLEAMLPRLGDRNAFDDDNHEENGDGTSAQDGNESMEEDDGREGDESDNDSFVSVMEVAAEEAPASVPMKSIVVRQARTVSMSESSL